VSSDTSLSSSYSTDSAIVKLYVHFARMRDED
jgi:hypothetical protein